MKEDQLLIKLMEQRYVITAIPAEDEATMYRITHARDAFTALYDIVNHSGIRQLIKHGCANERFESTEEALEWVRAEIRSIIQEYGLDVERGCG